MPRVPFFILETICASPSHFFSLLHNEFHHLSCGTDTHDRDDPPIRWEENPDNGIRAGVGGTLRSLVHTFAAVSAFLTPLLQLQRFFLPSLLALLVWAMWRTVFRRDLAVGLALYLGLVILVDGYLNTGLYLPGFEKGSIRYSEICAGFLLITRPPAPPQRPPRRVVSWMIALYFVLLMVSAFQTDPMLAGIFDVRRLIVPQVISFLIAKRGLGSAEGYRRFFVWLTALILIIGVFVFWEVFFDRVILKSEILALPAYWHNVAQRRFGGVFLNPNYLGAFVVLVFPPAFMWALSEQRPLVRLYAWTGLLALVFCLVETEARAAVLASGIAMLFLTFGPSGGVSRRRRLALFALLIVVVTVVMPGFYERAVRRFDTLDEDTSTDYATSRAVTWRYTLRIIADHPLGGIGFGERQFMKSMDAYGFSKEYGIKSLDAPHNSYLQVAVYAGIPALAAFLLANALLLGKSALVFLRGAADGSLHIAFGLAVGISGFLMCVFTDLQLIQAVAPVYWLFFALLLALVTAAPAADPAMPSSGGRKPTPALDR